MKKFVKKILAVCVSAAIAMSMAAISAVAEGHYSIGTDTEEYFSFANSDSRIDSNGDFTFEIRWSVDSESFRFKSTKSTLTVSAHIEDYITHDKTYSEHLCRIYLESGFSRKSFDFYADGTEYTFSLADLKTDKDYSISISNIDSLDSRHRVVGSGNLTGITIN